MAMDQVASAVGRPLDLAYRLLGTLLAWSMILVGFAFWVAVVIPVTLALAVVWPGARWWFRRVTSAALRFYFGAQISIRVEVDGVPRPPGPHVVVANHQSWFDPLVLLAFDPTLVGPSRGYILAAPLVGRIARFLGFMHTESWQADSFERIIAQAEAAAEGGQNLLYFPEGTRTRDGTVGPFARGAFRLAVERRIPVQPVVIEGLDAQLPSGKPWAQEPGRFVVRVRYLTPVAPPEDAGRKQVRAFAGDVRELIIGELETLRARRGVRGRTAAVTGVPERG
jgi:1-acyl-sn-glycerol-3-phosphate acyltransferase